MAVLLPLFATAQFILNGTIQESVTREPLAGANVMLNGTVSTQTNTEGYYTFSNLQPGKYTIRITYIGFKALDQAITISGDETVNMTLDKIALLLMK